MNRRNFLKIAGAYSLASGLPDKSAEAQQPDASQAKPASPPAEPAFSEQWLVSKAENLARQPYKAPELKLPSELADLDQERYRAIRFKPEAAIWKDGPGIFELQFLHTGFQYKLPVEIYFIEGGVIRPYPYSSTLFNFAAPLTVPPPDSPGGFSGLRVHAPINRPDAKDPFLIFQGASYFRAIASGQVFGVSARGISVNTAQPAGEEFPFYRAFWINKPAPNDRHLVIYALLDGPSLTGSYKFRIEPGRSTVMEVECTLFPRKPISYVGIAPLTSMYYFGTADTSRVEDYRPNVHSSEGLQMWNGGGEWIWRPLINPERLQYSVFVDKGPKGFGLLQRKRAFSDYEDIDARFDNRPTIWVEPIGDWGEGAVDLIEVPSRSEIYDNIIAFWRPKAPLAEIASHYFHYRLHWGWEPPVRSTKAYAVQTRVGAMADQSTKFFVIDFVSGGSCNGCNLSPFTADVRAGDGEIRNVVVRQNPATGGQRVTFEFKPGRVEQTDLRCELRQNGQGISETWIYRWTA
jgi:glucans biosynthesis protein